VWQALVDTCSCQWVTCAAVQLERFNKALSRGVGASRVWRYLSGRKGKNGVAASVSGDSLTVDDMLTYSPVCFSPVLTCDSLCSRLCSPLLTASPAAVFGTASVGACMRGAAAATAVMGLTCRR
jgi:hypothetical protein